jgi:hypothetical protein
MADEVLRSLENQVASVCMGAPSRIVRLRVGIVEKLEATAGRRAIVVRVPGTPLEALVGELGRRVDGRPRAAVLVDPLVRELAPQALGEEFAGLAEYLTAEALDEVPALAGRVLLARVAPVVAVEAGVAPEVVAALIAVRVGVGAFEVPAGDVLRALGRVAARAHVAIVLVGGDATLLEGAPGFVLVQEMQRAASGVVVLAEAPAASVAVPAPVVVAPTVSAPTSAVASGAPPASVEPQTPRVEPSALRKGARVGVPVVFVASLGVFVLVESGRWRPGVGRPSDGVAAVATGKPIQGTELAPPVSAPGPIGTKPGAPVAGAAERAPKVDIERGRVQRKPPTAVYSGPPKATFTDEQVEAARRKFQQDMAGAKDTATRIFLIQFASPAVPHEEIARITLGLLAGSGGSDTEARQARVGLIGQLGAVRDVPAALQQLLDAATRGDTDERLVALGALTRMPGALPESARSRIEAVARTDSDPRVRVEAQSALKALR